MKQNAKKEKLGACLAMMPKTVWEENRLFVQTETLPGFADCPSCELQDRSKCWTSCPNGFHYELNTQEHKAMKLSEITFKVIIGTIKRSEAIQQAVFTRGGTLNDGTTEPIAMVPFGFVWNGRYLSWVDFSEYLVHPGIEMTFAQALAAINNCEAPKKDSGAWIELDVEEDGTFRLPVGRGYWWGWAAALERHGCCDVLFGGWLFVDCDGSKCWSSEYMSRNDQGQLFSGMGGDRKPAVPVKIRFWRPAK